MRVRAAWFALLAFSASAAFATNGIDLVPATTMTPASPLRGGEVSAEQIALGAKLFSDPRLSIDGTMSCASCHDPKQAFTNPAPPVRAGMTDARLRRDVPSLLNVAFASPLHHDGGEPSLEVQILAPLFNEAEMANTTFDALEARLTAIPEYREAFEKLFGAPPSIEALGKAIAAYERSLVALDSAHDRWTHQNFCNVSLVTAGTPVRLTTRRLPMCQAMSSRAAGFSPARPGATPVMPHGP